ncbi:hypothetical protein H8D73_01505 [bacterium]|nr:hypothetical protein [bacterium]
MKGLVVQNRHLTHPVLVILVLLLALMLMVGNAWAGEGDPPEPPEAPEGPDDDPGAPVVEDDEGRGFENVGAGTRPRAQIQAIEFHPSYKLTYGREQDVSTWGHSFDLSYRLSPRINFIASSNINTRSNFILNKENRQETWNAKLNVAVTDAISMGMKFNRNTQVDVRDEGAANEVRSSREKETVDLTVGYRKTFLSGIKTTLSASSGIQMSEYADIRSQGSTETIGATFNYDPLENLTTSFTYSGGHSLLDASQGGDVEKQNESFNHALDSTIKYEWDLNSLEAKLRRSSSIMQYPKEHATEERALEGDGVSVSSVFAPMEDLSMTFDYSYSRSQAYYQIETTKDSDVTGHSVKGKVDYTFSGTKFSASLGSERKANEYFGFQTGDTYSDTFTTSLSRDFGERFHANMLARIALLSHHYANAEINDQDRDLFKQEVTLSMTYEPKTSITATLNLRVKQDELIYIRTSRTGDNKTSQTYSVQPKLQMHLSPTVSLTQRYTLSADYTSYTFDHTSNSLIRGLSIATELDWTPMAGLTFDAAHTYSGQDEGSYVEDAFGVEHYDRGSERDDHRVSLKVRYTFFDFIDIEAEQELSVTRKWMIRDQVRWLSYERHDTSITAKASVDHTLDDDSVLKISVARTLRDAANLTEQQADVWNISARLDRTF